jgi:hypothetical protein
VGADVFLSQKKIDHIARFVELPHVNSAGEIPSILIVNIQVPISFVSLTSLLVERCCKELSFLVFNHSVYGSVLDIW